jgi:uncharacterized protein
LGDTEIIRLLLKNGAQLETTNINVTPLVEATFHGNKDAVQMLIEAGAKTTMALHSAAMENRGDVVRILLELGVDIEERDPEGATALLYAVSSGCEGVVRVLLEKGVEREAKDMHDITALDYAVHRGHKVVETALREGTTEKGERLGAA